jgi:tetratricopeptide (TPR) repeat protein
VKKWVITIAAAVAFVAVGFTARWWVPQLKAFVEGNHEAVSRFNDLTDLVWRIIGSAAAAVVFLYSLWRGNKEKASNPGTVGRDNVGRDKIEVTINEALPPPAPSPAAVFPSLHQLQPPPADFTGREEEIKELLTAVSVGGVTISGLQGQGGVGKTALALKLAERFAPSFPDAQIYMDLLGVSQKPLTPGEAMAYVIRAFQPEVKLPEKEHEIAGIYQSVLHGKRALLLMDNARDAAQMRPLIPPAGCVLLVTSRFHFVLPGLHAKNLETLRPDKAEELLLKIAPRIGGEAPAIAKLCGYLPQALRLAATALAERVNMAPSDYRQRLADERNRTKLLAAGNESVEASISLSYGLLDVETQKRWRMLGVFPETFDGAAAAAVWSAEENSAEDTLGVLTQYSMLEWNEKIRRYRLHDLMRDFARQKLADEERYESSLRHAQHYLGVLRSADSLYKEGGDSLMSGLAQFDLEWGNVEAGQAWAKENAADDNTAAGICSSYPDVGAYYLSLRQHPREWIRWLEAGLAAARRLGHRSAEGAHLGNLGNAYQSLGEYRRAIEYYEQQLKITREVSDRRGEGNALGNLGSTYQSLGEYRRAIEYHEQSLRIAREIGDRQVEGIVLWNMSLSLDKLGDRKEAIKLAGASLKIREEIEDPFAPTVRKTLEEWRKG